MKIVVDINRIRDALIFLFRKRQAQHSANWARLVNIEIKIRINKRTALTHSAHPPIRHQEDARSVLRPLAIRMPGAGTPPQC